MSDGEIDQEIPAGQVPAPIPTPPMQPAGPQPAQSQSQLTPQLLMQLFGIEEEMALKIIQALPQICQASNQQQQRLAQFPGQDGFQTDPEREELVPRQAAGQQATGQQPTEEQINAMLQGALEAMELYPELMEAALQSQEPVNTALQNQQPPAAIQQPQGPPITQGHTTTRQGTRLPWLASTDEAGKVVMSDSLALDIIDSSIVVEDGILTADAVMTAAMVQDYSGKKVLKDPAQLQKACDAWLAQMPCTFKHPPEGVVMNQDEIVGWASPPTYDAENKRVNCSIKITDGPTIAAIQDGKTDVSIGFFCDLNEKPGKYEDAEYTAVQENIVFNHLAVGLDKGKGRCPNGTCGIQGDCDCEGIPVRCQNCDKTMTTTEDTENITVACPDCGSGMTTNMDADEECPCCADYTNLVKDMNADAQLTAAQRKALPANVFCGPDRSFPVPDCAHMTAALRMLGKYKGTGDKAMIASCIRKRGNDLGCPGAEDEGMSLHEQLLKERTEAVKILAGKIKEGYKTLEEEKFLKLVRKLRDLLYKLQEETETMRALEIKSDATGIEIDKALMTIGDAAILQRNIENRPNQPRTEAERAMTHFNLTVAQWTALSEEQKQDYLTKLPPRGTGLDEDKPVSAGNYELVAGRPDTHNHFAKLDASGNGTSTVNDDHSHKIKAFKVELTNEHSHNLIADTKEEETSMSDEEKKNADQAAADKAAADKAAADKAAADEAEPKNKAKDDKEAEPAVDSPPEKDEATMFVDSMMKKEHTTLVDSIMDSEPPRERSHYEGKSTDELKELIEFIPGQKDSVLIPASGSSPGNTAVDDAYAKVEEKLQSK